MDSVSFQRVGHLQSHQLLPDSTILIHDDIYGTYHIIEPVLLSLLKSADVQRLRYVHQHGVTSLNGLTPPVTRFEHCVGAMLLVRAVEGQLDEQVSALLHDVSHTALSHVVDFALLAPGEPSFHELHKSRFLAGTRLPELLREHRVDPRVFDEALYPLVEMPSPRLCADRLDYALRDCVAFGKLELASARAIFASLHAFPSSDAPGRLLVLDDVDRAIELSRAYAASDSEVWSNRAHMEISMRTGKVIKEMMNSGRVDEESLWSLSDVDFWALLKRVAGPEEAGELESLEFAGLGPEEGLKLPKIAKVRTLDPDVWPGREGFPISLSVCRPEWGLERQKYIFQRDSEREL